MNSTRIKSAAATIETCEWALKWLDEFGRRLSDGRDAATITVTLNYGSACPGAKQAQEMLSAMARFSLPEIVRATTANCRNTIELEREAIRRELDPPPAPDGGEA